jgi:hypothetical protein
MFDPLLSFAADAMNGSIDRRQRRANGRVLTLKRTLISAASRRKSAVQSDLIAA